MSRLICKFQVVGPVQTNCYFLYREDTKDCVIVDPGDEAKRIKKFIEDQELHPERSPPRRHRAPCGRRLHRRG